jgi:predicted enzyme involved in methoxymalonyl-ACP biosynthesis
VSLSLDDLLAKRIRLKRHLPSRQELHPLNRMTQLTNKTNQFNLTTRRLTPAEMESVLKDRDVPEIYGKLNDRFDNNGLISVELGHRAAGVLNIELWLMSFAC